MAGEGSLLRQENGRPTCNLHCKGGLQPSAGDRRDRSPQSTVRGQAGGSKRPLSASRPIRPAGLASPKAFDLGCRGGRFGGVLQPLAVRSGFVSILARCARCAPAGKRRCSEGTRPSRTGGPAPALAFPPRDVLSFISSPSLVSCHLTCVCVRVHVCACTCMCVGAAGGRLCFQN